MKKVIGILGGMGPAATADMLQKFIRFTPARCDQEHIPLLISSIPDIPDRTAALLHGGESPEPLMLKYIQGLERAGADCILIACNTAHYWFSRLQQQCHTKMLSMIEATVAEAAASSTKNIGLLATDATLATRLYQDALEARGLNCIVPDKASQQEVMKSIYLLKAGQEQEAEALMLAQKEALIGKGAEIMILGCTEIPVILQKDQQNRPHLYVDSTSALVRAAIQWYRQA
ncbi:aspartate racemase [Mesocricetibacter intestinalis]|uniref:Aspartate racemase n=1 Tax=Mesocricetibacter intestinalis TaxID=1521930 RepID=A0A4R6VD14_9PAST|nr:amino acid racemase [Mesocricetibacter intestinalis]TDQ59756.1 aspartate racemase [Mesocricetibacter intestinalis]